MNNLFIPYELALIAKEKGFNESCLGVWNAPNSLLIQDSPKNTTFYTSHQCLAPLYDQIRSWLFKTEGIWITIEDNQHTDLPDSGFQFYINVYGFCEVGISKYNPFTDHRLALNTALEEAFKLLI